ncbi:hypothetical protein CEXT_384321 [Caerostris extrusa]|uniref:Uncharacterized protein n=1 Tax=Caerostris extrusa TaxID=172846 RepID=A0AAV4WTX9_CAEEX|nr:hypothetical protein CEXT_384321 [Caerostris extrusa]
MVFIFPLRRDSLDCSPTRQEAYYFRERSKIEDIQKNKKAISTSQKQIQIAEEHFQHKPGVFKKQAHYPLPPSQNQHPTNPIFNPFSLFAHSLHKGVYRQIKNNRAQGQALDCYAGTTSTQTTDDRRRDSGEEKTQQRNGG